MNERKSKRRRRWFQFSLRTLMLFTLVCAIASARVGCELEETRREQAVVAEIEAMRGTVVYHDTDGPPWIAQHFRRVRWVDLGRPGITDAQLEYVTKHLRKLAGLEELWLDGAPITDAGLSHVIELRGLKILYLDDTRVTDTGLVHLKDIPHLRELGLRGTKITDVGVKQLTALSGLEELCLCETLVTDAGLEPLKEMAGLEILGLSYTKVTDEGVEKFQRLMPNCTVFRKFCRVRVRIIFVPPAMRGLPGNV